MAARARWTSLACNYDVCCAGASDATVSCWGYLESESVRAGRCDVPIRFPWPFVPVELVVADYGVCALDGDGRAFCARSQAMGAPRNDSGPVDVPHPLVHMASDGPSVCSIDAGSTVRCWRGPDGTSPAATLAVEGRPLDGVRSLSGRAQTYCAARGEAGVWCWGSSSSLRRGSIEELDPDTPTQLPLPGSFDHVWVSTGEACAQSSASELWCWGAAPALESACDRWSLGPTCSASARRVAGQVRHVVVGDAFRCHEAADGWRCEGALLVLGDLETFLNALPSEHIAEVEASNGGVLCALLDSGELRCFGDFVEGCGIDGERSPLGRTLTPAAGLPAPDAARLHWRPPPGGDILGPPWPRSSP